MTGSDAKFKISCVVGDITTTISLDMIIFTKNGNCVTMTAKMSKNEYDALVAEAPNLEEMV